jgi:hypothetical protein
MWLDRLRDKLKSKQQEEKPLVSYVALVDNETLNRIISQVPRGTRVVQGIIERDPEGNLKLVGILPETASSEESKR